MGADSTNGDDFGELDDLDAYAPSMLYGGWQGQDHSSISTRVLNGGSPVASLVAAASGTNVVATEKLRGQRLNDKLYALRSVVPNITKMDKLSIIKDAIAYVQQLQEQERRMLAEISVLEQLVRTEECGAPVESCAHQAMPPRKMMRRFLSSSSAFDMAATSPRVEDLEVRVMAAGDNALLVSIACRHRKGAMAKLCLAIHGLRLHVISASTTSSSGTMRHTALIQSGEIHQREMKELIETAIAQLDALGSAPCSMCYQ